MPTRPSAALCAGALLLLAGCRAGGEALELRPSEPPLDAPLRITADHKLAPGRYVRPPAEGGAVLFVEGLSGATIDLRGVELWAAEEPDAIAPHERRGRALLLRDCSDVTVLGGTLRGYREGLVLERCRDVRVEGLAVEGFFAQRLRSTSVAADATDELALEVPAPEEWLRRYGAAFALFDCSRVELRSLRARGGQNGLLLARSDGCELSGSDLSYLSGWGAALWRAVGCTVANNRLDACARGYVAGRYARPFGSAGLFVVGPPGGNVIARNRAVGCGVGGRALGPREEPAPGASPDLWLANDLRAAFGASLELDGAVGTRVLENRLGGGEGAGLVARRSSALVLHANRVEGAVGAALALVDSRGCLVSENVLKHADRGLELLGGDGSDERASREHWIVANRFEGHVQDLVLERSQGLVFDGNRFDSGGGRPHVEDLRGEGAPAADAKAVWRWIAGEDGRLPSGRGWRSSLRPAPGAPHPERVALASFEPPRLPPGPAPAPAAAEAGQALVLGLHGPWDPAGGRPRPEPRAPGGLLEEAVWDAVWFRWDESCDPRGERDAWRARRYVPVARAQVRGLADPWGGAARRAQIGAERFGLIAETAFELEQGGRFLLHVISDDGVRVELDGELAFEDWSWHAERGEHVELALQAGRHRLVVEYFQESAAAALAIGLDRRPQE